MSEQETEDDSEAATEANGVGRGSRSGTKYPFYDLEQAEKFVRSVQASGGNEVSEDDLLKHLGLSSSTKSWIYGLSTAKEFGLVERRGQKAEARILLTDLGKRLVMPGDTEEQMASRAAAFLCPPLYQKLVTRYRGGPLPQPEFLANILVREHKLLESVATPAAQAFIASAKFAGLAHGNVLVEGGKRNAAPAEAKPMGDAPPPPPAEHGSGERTLRIPSNFNLYSFPLRRELTVTIPLPSELTQKDVARLRKWLDTLVFDDEEEEVSP